MPSSPTTRTAAGSRDSAPSSDAATRLRILSASQRPASRKLTNIVSESNKGSLPNIGPGANVAPVLTTKVSAMPIETGRSMPMRRWRRPSQASRNIGAAENSTTGMLSSQAAQSSSVRRSALIAPGSAI